MELKVNEAIQPKSSIIFHLGKKDQEEILRFEPGGKLFLYGKEVEHRDPAVIKALRSWLKCTLQDDYLECLDLLIEAGEKIQESTLKAKINKHIES